MNKKSKKCRFWKAVGKALMLATVALALAIVEIVAQFIIFVKNLLIVIFIFLIEQLEKAMQKESDKVQKTLRRKHAKQFPI